MNMEEVNKLSALFHIVEQCAKHGNMNTLSSICMGEIMKYERDPSLLGVAVDKPEPKGDVTRIDDPEDNSNIGRPVVKPAGQVKPPEGPEGDGVQVPEPNTPDPNRPEPDPEANGRRV